MIGRMHLQCLIIFLSAKFMDIASQSEECEPIEIEKIKNFYRSIPLIWVDNRYRSETCPLDTFFDRMVGIVSRVPDKETRPFLSEVTIATGVLITDRLVLTSFNAFRLMIKRDFPMDKMRITVIRHRSVDREHKRVTTYLIDYYYLACARQVVPDFQVGSTPPMNNVNNGPHSPLHDLMVIRLKTAVTFEKSPPPRTFSLNKLNIKYKDGLYSTVRTGPIKTEIAKKDDVIGDQIYFASLGHSNESYMRKHYYMQRTIYNTEDKVLTDCNEWIPRNWGYFICVLNVDNFAGIASGGMLFSDEKLFGVGSFAVFKGDNSILVFTDVRPYYDLLFKTCTEKDQLKALKKKQG